MGSVSSLNPGVANLLETLSNVNSPVLSNPTVVSALESAPASDIVQMSESATQLESMDELLGISTSTSNSGSSALSNLLASLESSDTTTNAVTSSAAASSTTAASSVASSTSQAEQLAAAQLALQSNEVGELFGTGTTTTPSASSLFNFIG